jgi:hypothetical protein
VSFILFESHDQSEAWTINIASAVQSENVRASFFLFFLSKRIVILRPHLYGIGRLLYLILHFIVLLYVTITHHREI